MSTSLILLIVGCVIFGILILVAIIKAASLARYNKSTKFGYKPKQTTQSNTTGIPLLDNILRLNPDFINNGLEKTNLSKNNRIDPLTGTTLTIAQTLDRYPEEKVRLNCYLKCLQKFGKDRVEVEFPIQVGSKKCFIDVAVFHGSSQSDPKKSKDHNVLNLSYIFECKKDHANPNNKDRFGNPETTSSIMKDGLRQLKSYMAVCPNLVERMVPQQNGRSTKALLGLGCLTNGSQTYFYKKTINPDDGNQEFEQVSRPSWY